eukprot:COSAG01_NODE_1668_length_9563_cov_23.675613_11_plen_300_part_00
MLELGSGTGVLGCLCAQLGAATVTVSDLPAVVPLLRLNLLLNSAADDGSAPPDRDREDPSTAAAGTGAAPSPEPSKPANATVSPAPAQPRRRAPDCGASAREAGAPVRAVALPWGEPLSPVARAAVGGTPCDCVLLCDVVYEPTLFPPLLRTLQELCGADTLILMAYRRRNPDEWKFFHELAREGFSVEVLRSVGVAHSAAQECAGDDAQREPPCGGATAPGSSTAAATAATTRSADETHGAAAAMPAPQPASSATEPTAPRQAWHPKFGAHILRLRRLVPDAATRGAASPAKSDHMLA